MQDFEDYLQQRGYRRSTRKECLRSIRQYLQWCTAAHQQPEQAGYREVLAYCAYCRARGVSGATLRGYLRALGYWYNYKAVANPACDIQLRRDPQKVHLLSEEELRELYHRYRLLARVSLRNVVVLSFVLFQGLHSGHLGLVRLGDIDLQACRLHVRCSYRSNGRLIALQAEQVSVLQPYLLGKAPEELLIPARSGEVVRWICARLRKLDSRAVNALVLRRSVIAHWIERYGLRRAQYMAGHKHVSSTESCKAQSFGVLLSEVERLHPLQSP